MDAHLSSTVRPMKERQLRTNQYPVKLPVDTQWDDVLPDLGPSSPASQDDDEWDFPPRQPASW